VIALSSARFSYETLMTIPTFTTARIFLHRLWVRLRVRPPAVQLFAAPLALACLAATALAHVFWLEPSTFTPKSDEMVKIEVYVGDTIPGEKKKRDNGRIEKFECTAPDGTKHDVVGRDGHAPFGLDRLATPGTYIFSYRSNNATVTLATEKFDTYVSDHGMTSIVNARATLKPEAEDKRPVKEAYSRCAKSLVTVGEGSSAGFDRAVGLTVEVIPLTDPSTVKPGQPMTFRVLHEGKPFTGSNIFANREGALRQSQKPSDAGEVTFTLDAPGMWVIDTTFIGAAPSGVQADYQSVWSSLSFSIPAASTPAK